jgi:hypothetical protein
MTPCQGPLLLPRSPYYGPPSPEVTARSRTWLPACLLFFTLLSVLLFAPLFPALRATRTLPASRTVKTSSRTNQILLPTAPTFRFGLAADAPPKRARSPEDDDSEWALRLGKVVDTLRSEYPHLLTHPINPEIYHHEIELRDDHELRLKGLTLYLSLFHTMRLFCSLLGLSPEVTARFTVLLESREVRVRWNAKLNPSHPVPLYLDGISLYKVGRDGLVYQHTLQFVTMSFNPGVRVPAVPVWAGPPVFSHSHMQPSNLREVERWVRDTVFTAQQTWTSSSGLSAEPLRSMAPAVLSDPGPPVRQYVPTPLLTLARAFAGWLPR